MSTMLRFTCSSLLLLFAACGISPDKGELAAPAPAATSSQTDGSDAALRPSGTTGLLYSTRAGTPTAAELQAAVNRPTVLSELVPLGLPGGSGGESALPPHFSAMGPAFPSECVELGVSYPFPAYMVKVRVVGQPHATMQKWNYHESCASAGAKWERAETAEIPASGVLEMLFHTAAPFSCDDPVLGRWLTRVEVDGELSASAPITFHQSSCRSAFARCEWAKTLCPPTFHP